MSTKAYFRWLVFFVVLLGVAQFGWFAYFLTPRRPERRSEVKYLAFRKFASPSFKYRFEVDMATGLEWQEKAIEPEQGRKILDLLRGSRSLSLVMDEYRRQNPRLATALITPAIGHPVGRLTVFEQESKNPALTIEILDTQDVVISAPGRETQTFVIERGRLKELDAVTADIQWGQIPEDEPPEK